MATDFEKYHLATQDVVVRGRWWLFTVDFEAFDPAGVEVWIDAMHRWADVARRERCRSCIFLALEDVARLRHERPEQYERFLEAARRMAGAGSTFYPHNHGVFDEETGRQHPDRPEHIDGYPKRASMFFDVVYRHHVDIRTWLGRLKFHYESFLGDARLPMPDRLAFRAGGWDYGADEADARAFVSGLAEAGFDWDSSASTGVFGTRTWRIGAPYGRNVFSLAPGLLEAAACWPIDGLGRLSEPRTARVLLRPLPQHRLWLWRPGVFVTVFHFSSLFRGDARSDASSVARRIEAVFAKQAGYRSLLRMSTATFDEIVVDRVGR